MTDARGLRAPVLQVALALAAVYVIWGSTYLAMAIAIETLPPFWMAGVRHGVAGIILYLFARSRGAARPTRIHWRSAAIIGGFLLLGGNGGVVWAEQRVDSGIAALLVSTVPLWMVLLEAVRPGGSRPSGRVVLGVALGFAGLIVLVRPTGGGGIDLLGMAALMIASLSWAWGSLQSRRVQLPESPLLATAMEMLAGGGLLLLAGLVSGEASRLDLASVSLRSGLALGYLIAFGSLIGFTAYIWLLRAASPVLASTYAYVNPIVAVFLGWLVLSEPLTSRTLIAAPVIVAGVILITTSQARRRAEEVETPKEIEEAPPLRRVAVR